MYLSKVVTGIIILENVKSHFQKKLHGFVTREEGDWLGNMGWIGIYAIGAIAVATAVLGGMTALGSRINTHITSIT